MSTPEVVLAQLPAAGGPDSLRHAFAQFPSGVTAVCGMKDGLPQGMAASSFTSVSVEPPLVSVCVAKTSTTWPVLAGLAVLGVSVLSQEHGEVCRALSAKTGDRFANVDWQSTDSGAVFVHGSTLWLECSVQQVVVAGDHEIIVLLIGGLAVYPDAAPLVFHRSSFRQLAS